MQEMSETGGKTWVVTLTSVASFMVALDALVVTTALSTIRIDLGASLEALEWTVNAYNLSFAVLLLTGAALGDRFGRRRIFAAGLTLFVVASAACALAGNIGALIAARSVQGAGAALVMPLAMALLSAAFPREKRGKALAIFSAACPVAFRTQHAVQHLGRKIFERYPRGCQNDIAPEIAKAELKECSLLRGKHAAQNPAIVLQFDPAACVDIGQAYRRARGLERQVGEV